MGRPPKPLTLDTTIQVMRTAYISVRTLLDEAATLPPDDATRRLRDIAALLQRVLIQAGAEPKPRGRPPRR